VEHKRRVCEDGRWMELLRTVLSGGIWY
jgi:hypothetical protein